jgi:hypothetical protein
MNIAKVPLNEINLSDPEFWARDREYREGAFHTLRQESPYQFFEEWEFLDSPIPRGPGYIALTRHDDIWHVSRHPELFCSGKGANIADLTVELNEFFGSFIAMDDPKHFRLRSIVSKGFAPKEIRRVEDFVTNKATELVDNLLAKFPNGECDFVNEIAAPFPLTCRLVVSTKVPPQIIRGVGPVPSVTAQLPAGLQARDGNVTIVARALDVYLSQANTSTEIAVVVNASVNPSKFLKGGMVCDPRIDRECASLKEDAELWRKS